MHINLFRLGHGRAEVRDALNRDQARDSRTLKIFDLILMVSLVFALKGMEPIRAFALFAAVFSGITGLRYFIDQSNRNFYLHMLDWQEAGEAERTERRSAHYLEND